MNHEASDYAVARYHRGLRDGGGTCHDVGNEPPWQWHEVGRAKVLRDDGAAGKLLQERREDGHQVHDAEHAEPAGRFADIRNLPAVFDEVRDEPVKGQGVGCAK